MKRVYIDSNVFRFLKKKDNEFYSKLYDDLNSFSDRLIYYFSHAHILDLERDKTNHKYDDLIFMEKFVKSNYLLLPYKDTFVNVQIATPTEVFQGQDKSQSLEEIFNFDNLFDDEELKKSPEMVVAKELLEKAMNTILKVDLKTNLEEQSEEAINLSKRLIPVLKDEYKLSEWISQFSNLMNNLYEDKSLYKNLRRNTIETLNLKEKYNININDFNFDENLRNTPLQKSFLELVEESMSNNNYNNEQKEFNFLITGFSLLNILGIDNEANKKVKFANTLHDAQHAYYAAHCDYLVSDDEGLIVKAKVLYKLLEIETQALTVDEFSKSISVIAEQNELNLNRYFKLLEYDIKNALIIDKKTSIVYDREYTTLKPSVFHFGYFNQFDFIIDKDEGKFLVFYKQIKNYSRFTAYTELESITNKIVEVFGQDDYFKGKYTLEDTKQINSGNWKGRIWTIEPIKFLLEINLGTKELSFIVILN
jgi:hypothetical protein